MPEQTPTNSDARIKERNALSLKRATATIRPITASSAIIRSSVGLDWGRLTPLSSADTTHRAGWGNEVRLANFVPGLFLPNNFLQIFLQLEVIGAAAKARAQIVFLDAEKAGADFSIGGQSPKNSMSATQLHFRGEDIGLP